MHQVRWRPGRLAAVAMTTPLGVIRTVPAHERLSVGRRRQRTPNDARPLHRARATKQRSRRSVVSRPGSLAPTTARTERRPRAQPDAIAGDRSADVGAVPGRARRRDGWSGALAFREWWGRVATAGGRSAYESTGRLAARGWVKASIRTSDVEVTHRVRAARLVTAFPQCGRELGPVVWVSPRSVSWPGPMPIRAAATSSARSSTSWSISPRCTRTRRSCGRCAQWERIADADDARRAGGVITTPALAPPRAPRWPRCSNSSPRPSSPPNGTTCADASATTPARLARAHRGAAPRADALASIFEAAATTLPDARRPEPVVNILIDQAVYESPAGRHGWRPTPRPDPADLARQRCQTTSGGPVDPADAVAASVVGWVRRVVVDADGVIINLGRRSRVFTGSARMAAILQAALDDAGRCSWPGCGHHRIQIDHSLEWTSDGPTDLRNGGPLCGRHNRLEVTRLPHLARPRPDLAHLPPRRHRDRRRLNASRRRLSCSYWRTRRHPDR